MAIDSKSEERIETRSQATVRFAGDSGDGMQLTGNQFTKTNAVYGNDLATLPDFPAEIRAPTGSLPGVSGFQISFSSNDIHTPGDNPDVLVAMNPAALKTNLTDLIKGGLLIVDADEFKPLNLRKAGYEKSPLEDGSLAAYQLISVNITQNNEKALEDLDLKPKERFLSRNFYALGIILWLFNRPLETVERWATDKFSRNPIVLEANLRALRAGNAFAETTELIHHRYEVAPAEVAPGTYRHINGNEATALGLVAASQLADIPIFYASYPITPATDVLHELAKHRNFGVKTMQAEDEMAAVCAAIGSSYAGSLGITGTSGPGLALKSEAINLALMTELPLVVLDIQRAGPSTGMPTKTEQSDLLQAMYGRNGDSPVIIIAPATPGECFEMAIEAVRLALTYMTPVIYLSDGYLANGSSPWLVPSIANFDPIPNNYKEVVRDGDSAYDRDPETLVRRWAIPGQKGLEHRVGGIEKSFETGNINYEPSNHHKMTLARAQRIAGAVRDIPDQVVNGPEKGDLLVLGWGGTYGAITSAVTQAQEEGMSVASAHIRYLNPFPKNLEEILNRYETILIPELNNGQLSVLIRALYNVDAIPFGKISGQPFKIKEILGKIHHVLGHSKSFKFDFEED